MNKLEKYKEELKEFCEERKLSINDYVILEKLLHNAYVYGADITASAATKIFSRADEDEIFKTADEVFKKADEAFECADKVFKDVDGLFDKFKEKLKIIFK